ncbi:MAG: hypothetical protein AAF587_26565 [Bacteroidota bacterium]
MPNTIAIRREDLSKKGEKRVAIPPSLVSTFIELGNSVLVQPNIHPKTGEEKRAFSDQAYLASQARVQEDISDADIIFGLKEIDSHKILPNKVYFFFSHTHKGQIKNRSMLKTLVERNVTLIDYELIVDEEEKRILTSFTFFAGYAGMIDSLWTYGQRMKNRQIMHVFEQIPQSIDWQNLDLFKRQLSDLGDHIRAYGTPASLPPCICCFLGNGKTSTGAQEIFDLLPTTSIRLDQLQEVFENGDKKQVYKLVLDIPQLYRFKAESSLAAKEWTDAELFRAYLQNPNEFESNLDQVFPYCSIMMNCILWSPEYPRLISRDQAHEWYSQNQTLEVIGDITCDPEGAIEFSQETWIDQPVFIYNPRTRQTSIGFEGEGIAVMAVTNLPCEFPKDASNLFGENLAPLLSGIAQSNLAAASLAKANFPQPIEDATILWQGNFTDKYAYMKAYLEEMA